MTKGQQQLSIEGAPTEIKSLFESDRQEPLVLVCASDDCYAMPLAVMLYSALLNYRGPGPADIFILDAGISPKNNKRIRTVLRPFNIHLNWLTPDTKLLDDVPLGGKLDYRLSAYYRLLIAESLPLDIRKAIYLDCDILVLGDLNNLWQMDMKGNILLAAKDDGCGFLTSPLTRCSDISVTEEDMYFNSGVMLINIQIFRSEQLPQKIVEFCKTWRNLIDFADQDGLNAICLRRWGQLDPRWNYFIWSKDNTPSLELKSTRPHIIHYAANFIPWKMTTYPPSINAIGYAKQLWQEYLIRSNYLTINEGILLHFMLMMRSCNERVVSLKYDIKLKIEKFLARLSIHK